MKLGETEEVPASTAVLPAGRWVRVQAYVSGSPFTSEEALPLRITVEPVATVWFGPALATGGVLVVLMTIVSVSVPAPLVTVSFAMYVPGASTTNVDITVVALRRKAAEPAGRERNVQV